jgi:hypothetical protein
MTENILQAVLKSHPPYKLDNVLKWVHIESNGLRLMDKLKTIFG